MDDLKNIIANNLIALRKNKNLTQAEFAEKINYSDKAISKWERAESLPDITVLKQVADFFGVTVDYLLKEHSNEEPIPITDKKHKKFYINKFPLTLLAASPVWIISTLLFVLISMFVHKSIWFVFYISVPVTLLVFIIFNTIYGNQRKNYILVSLFVWSILLCFYLSFIKYSLWQLFILGIPAQIIIILWSKLRTKKAA